MTRCDLSTAPRCLRRQIGLAGVLPAVAIPRPWSGAYLSTVDEAASHAARPVRPDLKTLPLPSRWGSGSWICSQQVCDVHSRGTFRIRRARYTAPSSCCERQDLIRIGHEVGRRPELNWGGVNGLSPLDDLVANWLKRDAVQFQPMPVGENIE